MRPTKISKGVPIQETIKKITRKAHAKDNRQPFQLSGLNKTVRSVFEQKRSSSRKSSPRNTSIGRSPKNTVVLKYDSYFKFVKDEKIRVNMGQTCLWDRLTKTPMPGNYGGVPLVDERRRSVMDQKRYKRASESPYQRSNKDKNVKKNSQIDHQIINKRKSRTPRSRQIKEHSSKHSVQLLQEQAQKSMFEGIEFFRDLGRGAHALVRSAVDWKNNRKIAIKVYKKNDLTEQQLSNIEREVDILEQIDHPGIAMLYDIVETPLTINLVMEYGGGNSLHQYLRSRTQGRFEESEAKGLFKQILQAIAYLQSKSIVHRDIKPQNILLNKAMKVKIIDFGFSLISSINEKVSTYCGTPTYMAPEIVNKIQHIGLFADRWSLGVLLYTMLQGIYPFRASTERQLFRKISKGQVEYMVEVSSNAKRLIERFLRLNPVERISPVEALKDPWFQQI